MKFKSTEIEGVWLVESEVHNDERGSFFEWFRVDKVKSQLGINFSLEQANISKSKKNVIRGMHYSLNPKGQAKWITCVHGSIKDVVVDLRENSPTFMKHVSIEINHMAGNSIIISSGMAHGFLSQTESSITSYLLSSLYKPELEYAINPFDPDIEINWGIKESEAILSSKDKNAASFKNRVVLK
jgi:dTDP-4-dehydrorhamnose 3,5-epimerase